MDAKDVDVLFRMSHAVYDSGSPSQRDLLEAIERQDFYDSLHCDSYVSLAYPEGSPEKPADVETYGNWLSTFGLSRGNYSKGIAVVKVFGGMR